MSVDRQDSVDAWVFRQGTAEMAASDCTNRPLAAMEFGVKDIIDVAGMPTAYGVTFATRIADRDAWCVAALRAAGAIPVGKTHTTAFAFLDPAITRNPRDPSRTPGGSSAGSAAAVGAGHVPFALATQSYGSILRPAAYCGVVGYKPTWGRVPTVGVAPLSPSTDTIGIIARDVSIASRAAAALFPVDTASPASPRLGVALDYMSEIIDPCTRQAIQRAVARLCAHGVTVVGVQLPACIEETTPHLSLLQKYEAYAALGAWLKGKPVPTDFAAMLADGRQIKFSSYDAVRSWREAQRDQIAAIFDDIDALLIPAANLAPDRATTGDPTPLGPWTFFGLPTLALPIGADPATSLPFSMQIVAPSGADGGLLATSAIIEEALAS